MKVEIAPQVKAIYPHLAIVPLQSWKLLSICQIDKERCLDPREYEEDYSVDGWKVTRVFTAFAENCSSCPRNPKKSTE